MSDTPKAGRLRRRAIARQREQILLQLDRWLEMPMLVLGLVWLVLLVVELVRGLSPQQKGALGVDHGVQVQQVAPGAAARAGVRPGDVILQLGGKRIDSAATLRAEAAALPEGKPTAMLVRRGEGTVFLPVTPDGKNVG